MPFFRRRARTYALVHRRSRDRHPNHDRISVQIGQRWVEVYRNCPNNPNKGQESRSTPEEAYDHIYTKDEGCALCKQALGTSFP